jgi:DNA invertase Pin-like site-specific DNA recombinase
MRAIAYLRVSTDEQSTSGLGLEAQLHACGQYAARNGWDHAATHADEGVSGAAGLDRRPALLEAIAALGRGDILLVAKRDRLGRDPIAVAMIEAAVARRRARIVSVAGEGTAGDGATDVLMRRIVDAFAEYERLVIKARTKAALAAKSRRGERVGSIPYGYDLAGDGKTLTPNHRELVAAELMQGMRAEGATLRGIAGELDERGIPTKTGQGRWTHQAVARIVARPATTTGGDGDGRKVG